MVKPSIQLVADDNCKYCGGGGYIHERHPYGSTYATETLLCDCLGATFEKEIPDSWIVEPVPGPLWQYNQIMAYIDEEARNDG